MAAGRAILVGSAFVRAQLKEFLPKESTAILRRATAAIARNVRDDIRSNAPRRTGTLRKAVVAKRQRGKKNRMIEAAVFITKGNDAKHDAFYWHMVEYGTQTAPARPFVTPAVERAREFYQEKLDFELSSQIRKQLEIRAKRQRLGK